MALVLLCLASFMAVVDDTIALPSMRRDLGFSGADAQWIFNGYMLAFGGLVVTEFNPDHADENGELAAKFVRRVVGSLSAANGG